LEGWDGPGAVAGLLARPELVVARHGKGGEGERLVDVRPHLILAEYAGQDGDGCLLRLRVRTGSTGGARPEEYLPALGRFARVEIERTEVWLQRKDQLVPAL
jgi:hypothetical protein